MQHGLAIFITTTYYTSVSKYLCSARYIRLTFSELILLSINGSRCKQVWQFKVAFVVNTL